MFLHDCSYPHRPYVQGVSGYEIFIFSICSLLVFLIWIPQCTMSIKGETNGPTISRSCWKQPSGGQHKGEPPDLGWIVIEGCLLNKTFCLSWIVHVYFWKYTDFSIEHVWFFFYVKKCQLPGEFCILSEVISSLLQISITSGIWNRFSLVRLSFFHIYCPSERFLNIYALIFPAFEILFLSLLVPLLKEWTYNL